MTTLRSYQTDAIDIIHKRYSEGVSRQLVVMPTGTGKTVTFSAVISQRPGRAIVIAHREELLTQAIEKLAKVAPTLQPGIVQGALNQADKQVVMASVATIANPNRATEILKHGRIDTIIVDEAHHAVSKTWTQALDHLGAFHPKGPLVVGFTATPDRTDGKGLGWVFEEIVYERNLWEMILAGYLSDLTALQVKINVDLAACKTSQGDWENSSLGQAMMVGQAPEQVAKAYKEYAHNRKGVVFTPTIAVAEDCARQLRLVGINAEHIHGQMSSDTRKAVLRRLRTGTTQVVCNAALLLEGFDEPGISCVVIARPTKSRSLYTQAIGRGTRRHPGKEDCLILDCVGVATEQDLVTIASLLDTKVEKDQTLKVTELLLERDPTLKAEHVGVPQGTLVAQQIELFAGRSLHWVPLLGGDYVLSAPKLRVRLSPAGPSLDRWRITVHKDREPAVTLPETYELDWAQGVAEDMIREMGLERVLASDAKWRNEPMTDAQAQLILSLGVGAPAGCTKGQATDIIAKAQAQRDAKAQRAATRKQLAMLTRLGVNPPDNLTVSQAAKLIDQTLAATKRNPS